MSSISKKIEEKFKGGSSIEVIEDKFKGKKTSQLNRSWVLLKDNNLNEILLTIEYLELKLNHTEIKPVIVTENEEENYEVEPTHSVVRLLVHLQSKDWWFLNRGELILLAGNKVINLGKPVGRNSFTGTVKINNKETHVVCNEHCVYFLKESDLKNICESNSLELQISGKSVRHEYQFDRINHDYFLLFFNKTFDSHQYVDVVKKLEEFERESAKANAVGGGVGCALPIILFIILYNLYEDYERNEYGNIIFGIPFFTAFIGLIIYIVMSNKAKKKASQ